MKPLILYATLALLCPLLLATDIRAGAFHPIVYVDTGVLVGGVAEGKWLNDERAVKLLRGGESYHVYGFNKLLGLATGGKPTLAELPH